MTSRTGKPDGETRSEAPLAERGLRKGQGSRKRYFFNALALRSMAQNCQRGLTLIEVLTAVSILAIGIIGVLRAYAGSISTLEVGQFTIDAVNQLKSHMSAVEEQMLSEESPPTSGRGEEGDFVWEWHLSSTGIEGLKALTLTVSHKVNPRTFTLNSYVVEKEKEEL